MGDEEMGDGYEIMLFSFDLKFAIKLICLAKPAYMLPVVYTTLSPEVSKSGRYSVTIRIYTISWNDWAISLLEFLRHLTYLTYYGQVPISFTHDTNDNS